MHVPKRHRLQPGQLIQELGVNRDLQAAAPATKIVKKHTQRFKNLYFVSTCILYVLVLCMYLYDVCTCILYVLYFVCTCILYVFKNGMNLYFVCT